MYKFIICFVLICCVGFAIEKSVSIGDFKEDIVPETPLCDQKVLPRSINWIIDNIDKATGWSLTGLSKMGLNNDFSPWYVKFGIINGRIRYENEMNIAENENWQLFQDWERHRYNDNIIVGFHFYKELGNLGLAKKFSNEDIIRNDPERMLKLGKYYSLRRGIKSYNASKFLYGEVIKRYPGTRISVLAKYHIDELEKNNG